MVGVQERFLSKPPGKGRTHRFAPTGERKKIQGEFVPVIPAKAGIQDEGDSNPPFEKGDIREILYDGGF